MLAALEHARSKEIPDRLDRYGDDSWPAWPDAAADLASVPLDRQLRVMLVAQRVMPKFLKPEAGRQVIPEDIVEDFLDAMADELAHEDFQLADERAIRLLLRLVPLHVPKTGAPRDQHMREYEIAARIFNLHLLYAQKLGFRLDEKTVKWTAIQSVESRERRKSK